MTLARLKCIVCYVKHPHIMQTGIIVFIPLVSPGVTIEQSDQVSKTKYHNRNIITSRGAICFSRCEFSDIQLRPLFFAGSHIIACQIG